MLKSSTYGSVTRLDLARTLAGRGRYWTTTYDLDDLLINSGSAHTARDLVEILQAEPDWYVTHDCKHCLSSSRLQNLPFRIGTPGDKLAWLVEQTDSGIK